MKLKLDTTGLTFTVAKDVEPKNDQHGNQRSERGTGRLMWATQVIVLGKDGGDVITIATAGEKPNVKVGQVVSPVELEAMPWVTEKRNGVAFRAVELKIGAGGSLPVSK